MNPGVVVSMVAWLVLGAFAPPLWAQDGAALYEAHCAICHDADEDAQAPNRTVLRQLAPEQILVALERGSMRRQGADRSRAERRAIAEFLSGHALHAGSPATVPPTAYCSKDVRAAGNTPAATWNGGGVTLANTRFQTGDAAGLASTDLPRLKLRWAFGFPGASSASAQPVVWGGRVYVGSWEGDVYALDANTGCVHWSIEVEAGVRSAISLGTTVEGTLVAYFGDLAANVYAVDAMTGAQRWKVKVDDYAFARSTGSRVLHNGRLYVPVASREESQASNPKFPCCRFRGSMVALDAASGRQIWKTHTIPDAPRPTVKNEAGVQMWGPSGVAIWVTPTIDPPQNALYVGTSNAYSAPATVTSDAIVAFDLDSGRIRWVRQMTPGDVWNGSCPDRASDHANCNDRESPDFDFAASPILVRLPTGGRLLLAAQKSGVVYALDPDREGAPVWEQRVGKGGTSGGIMWGPATDEAAAYVALSDATRGGAASAFDPAVGGGLFALALDTGRLAWSTPAPPCGDRDPCTPAQAAAVTAIPGVVFSGSNDGHLRAYSTTDGRILWDFDTVRDHPTVNGIPAKGGSINNGGPAVVDGMVFTNSGYSHHTGVIPGNVLLAFGLEPEAQALGR